MSLAAKLTCVILLAALLIPVQAGVQQAYHGRADPAREAPSSGTLYVGGDGPGNYTTIQAAVDAAGSGDTIYVYPGEYRETIAIETTVSLVGEDKNTTVINGSGNGDVVTVQADNVSISGFTVTGGGSDAHRSGLRISSHGNTIHGCIVRDNGRERYCYEQGGLYLDESTGNRIIDNELYGNRETGVYLHHSSNNVFTGNHIHDNGFIAFVFNASSDNTIAGNSMHDNYCGMTFWPYSAGNTIVGNHVYSHPGCGIAFKAYSDGNIVRYNRLEDNLEWGVMLGPGPTMRNVVEYNDIRGATGGPADWYDGAGIVADTAFLNTIRYNNLADNNHDVWLENSLFNGWRGNHWANHSGGVKVLQGSLYWPWNPDIRVPWLYAADWQPAATEYDLDEVTLAVMDTSHGAMVLALEHEKMPITTENFVRLAADDFFDGLVFHRVIDDFVIQGGGYTADGTRRESPYGPIELETHPEVLHVDGAISMARTSDPDSATSQFFICDGAQPHLDGSYAAFGRVVGSMATLRSIASVDTTMKHGMQDWPVEEVVIRSVRILE
ncbi:MAG: peptidylprolyl isomerase [Thermoplasmatota archaeon]